MKKRLLLSFSLLTCLSFYSCGGKTVKVKLIGKDHISFSKTEDTFKVDGDYVVTAIPDRGYWLYEENLKVFSNGIQLSDYEKSQYYLDVDSQKITVVKSAIMGDIEIQASGVEKFVTIEIIVPSGYEGIETKKDDWVYGETYKKSSIKRTDLQEIKKEDIIVTPSDVTFKLDKDSESNIYDFTIEGDQFYRDITVTFPEIK